MLNTLKFLDVSYNKIFSLPNVIGECISLVSARELIGRLSFISVEITFKNYQTHLEI